MLKLPNHHLFNALPPNKLGNKSPLLECRIAQQHAANAPAAPIMHFHLADMFRPPPTPTATTPLISSSITTSLLPAGRVAGPRIALEDFCKHYNLSDSVHKKLDKNGYVGSWTLPFADVQELREANFRPGEIAQLKDVVLQWSQVA